MKAESRLGESLSCQGIIRIILVLAMWERETEPKRHVWASKQAKEQQNVLLQFFEDIIWSVEEETKRKTPHGSWTIVCKSHPPIHKSQQKKPNKQNRHILFPPPKSTLLVNHPHIYFFQSVQHEQSSISWEWNPKFITKECIFQFRLKISVEETSKKSTVGHTWNAFQYLKCLQWHQQKALSQTDRIPSPLSISHT